MAYDCVCSREEVRFLFFYIIGCESGETYTNVVYF